MMDAGGTGDTAVEDRAPFLFFLPVTHYFIRSNEQKRNRAIAQPASQPEKKKQSCGTEKERE